MKQLLVVALALVAACGKNPQEPTPTTTWTEYRSIHWEYLFTDGVYHEGIASVAGQFALGLADPDSVRLVGDVTVRFWSTENGTDTAYADFRIPPADGFVLRGRRTSGNPFVWGASNQPGSWPTLGSYTVAGDTIDFLWEAAEYGRTLRLAIRYVR